MRAWCARCSDSGQEYRGGGRKPGTFANFRDYSVERLLRLLTALGRDVQINIRKSQSSRTGTLTIGGSTSEQFADMANPTPSFTRLLC